MPEVGLDRGEPDCSPPRAKLTDLIERPAEGHGPSRGTSSAPAADLIKARAVIDHPIRSAKFSRRLVDVNVTGRSTPTDEEVCAIGVCGGPQVVASAPWKTQASNGWRALPGC